MRRAVDDNGTSVILDLHGRTLDEAEALVRKTVQLAASRGRTSVRVIHGSSTSDPFARNRTIKHLMERLAAPGALPDVNSSFATDDVTVLSLPITPLRDSRRITAADIL